MARVLYIPDIHAPFQHRDTLPFLSFVQDAWQTNMTILAGDEVDNCAISDYPSDPSGMGALDEFYKSMEFMKLLYDFVGDKAKVCISNHGSRPFRQAFKAGLPEVFLKAYHEFMEAPKGWKWADYWEVDGVRYEHGDAFSGMYAHKHAVMARMQSVAIGHVHSHAGVASVSPRPGQMFFGLNAGCLIDIQKYAFKYAKGARAKPSLGCGVVIDGVPYFVPMLVNSKNRWTGVGVI